MKYYQAHRYGFFDWMDEQLNKKVDTVIALICILTILIIIYTHKLGILV